MILLCVQHTKYSLERRRRTKTGRR